MLQNRVLYKKNFNNYIKRRKPATLMAESRVTKMKSYNHQPIAEIDNLLSALGNNANRRN